MKFPVLVIIMVANAVVDAVLVICYKKVRTTALGEPNTESHSEQQDSTSTILDNPITFLDGEVSQGYYDKRECLLILYEIFVSKGVPPQPSSGEWVVQMHSCTWNGEEVKDLLIINYNLYAFSNTENIPKEWSEFADVGPPTNPRFKVCVKDRNDTDAQRRLRFVGIDIGEPPLNTEVKLKLKYKIVTRISPKELVSYPGNAAFRDTDYCVMTENTSTPLIPYRLLMRKIFPSGEAVNQKLVLRSVEFKGKVYTGDLKLRLHFFRDLSGVNPESLEGIGTATQSSMDGTPTTFMIYTAANEENAALKYTQYTGFENNGTLII